ncbi:MAG: alanine racemase [Acidimicrobiia bacterium]|nr:alanine racemase [Acidimicrobiia bacterium]
MSRSVSALEQRCRVDVDLGAIAHNVRVLQERAVPAALCAVVKGDGYGHGAVEVARSAVAAGASWLGVACAAEAVPLRRAGLDVPVLVLAEPPPADYEAVLEHGLRAVVYTAEGIDGLAAHARRRGARVTVHLKVDTGMHRAGCEGAAAPDLAIRLARDPAFELEGLMTHLATSDEPSRPDASVQLERFRRLLGRLRSAGWRPAIVHAANSSGLLAHPDSHFDLVRAGIALYGLGPFTDQPWSEALRPALSLHARVSRVGPVRAGEGVSYGLRWRAPRDSVLATLSIGYGDGVRRALGAAGAPVLLGGRRCPMVGVVTMDQLVVDCGPGATVRVGDTATLIGRQGREVVGAGLWAELLDTIDYEVVTGIGPRVARRYLPGVRGNRLN